MSSPSEAGPAGVPAPPPGAVPGSSVPPAPQGALATGRADTAGPAGPDRPQRLHPAALGVWALEGVGPLLLLLVAGTLNILFAVVALALGAAASAVRWLRFTWHVDDAALVIEQGVIQRQRRVIPLERIQTVEAVRKLRHRIFGVTALNVEAVGGHETQGQLDALAPDLAERLRRDLLRRRSPSAPEAGAAEETVTELAHVRPRRLVVAGLTGGRVGVLAAILGFASQIFGEQVGAAIATVQDFVGAQGVQGVLLAVVLFLVAVFGLSVAATTLTFWGFTLTRDRRSLYTRRGLLDQRTGTVPLHRVQSVSVDENLLRRWLGLATVRVEVAGQPGDAAEGTSVLLPIGERDFAVALAAQALGRPDLAEAELVAMPRGARDRRLVRAGLATAAVTAALVVWLGPPGLLGLAAAVPSGGLALAAYRSLGRATPDGAVVARRGVWVRRTTFTLEPQLQAVATTATVFQRRRGLATLVLHIARSPGGGGDPEVVDVAEGHARAELVRLAAAAAQAGRRRVDAEGRMVRAERAGDRHALRELLPAACGSDAAAEPLERLRAREDFDASRSLVCELDGELLGHALLTPAGDGVEVLAPYGVLPEHRGRGIGRRLVRAALASAARRGTHRVVALGPPGFLGQLGFVPAEEAGVRVEASAPAGQTWMVRALPADDGSGGGRVSLPDELVPA